jgi:hypothetical protein
MHEAVLAAGVCINVPNAHFSTQWRVKLADGSEAHFADTTGKRLIMRGLIDHDRTEPSNGRAVRFVPVEASAAKPNVVKFVRPKAVKPANNAIAHRLAHETPTPREYKPWSHRGEHMTPWGIVNLGLPPSRRTILDRLEQINRGLSQIVGRWESLPAEIRAEVMTNAYEPLLLILLQCNRAGQKPKLHRRPSYKEATNAAAEA